MKETAIYKRGNNKQNKTKQKNTEYPNRKQTNVRL
jgi:23S rRNA maturation mini-RNase III